MSASSWCEVAAQRTSDVGWSQLASVDCYLLLLAGVFLCVMSASAAEVDQMMMCALQPISVPVPSLKQRLCWMSAIHLGIAVS